MPSFVFVHDADATTVSLSLRRRIQLMGFLGDNCMSCVCLICVLVARTCSQPSAVDGRVMKHGINLL